MKKTLKLVDGKSRSAMHSPIALTFEAEVKRMAAEKGLSMEQTMSKLAGFTGLDERQLYNYRSGKCDIPCLLIPVFCKQFESNALAMALIGMCDDANFDADDAFDLARFCAGIVQDMLKGGVAFMDMLEDNRLDGREIVRIKNVRAKLVRDINRLVEVAVTAHERRAA
jgi:hypothetical protein